MARVLFTSCPAYGHLLPMLPLIRAAQRAGHDVRVATGPDLVGPLAARGLDVHAVGPAFATSWSAHEAVWADPGVPEEQKMMDGVVVLFGTPALARLADLVVMAHRWRPDLVVHEVLEVAGSLLGRRLEVPGVVHGIGPMFPFYAQLIGPAGAAIGEPRLDPDDLGPVPANAVVAEFAPQAPLLERADLLVSHSGSGTMLGGLVHGVPQVALPRGTDQPQNAALLARAGAGVVVAPEDYAVPTIRAAVAEVTGDPAFRVAAERIRDEIAAMPDADAVWAGLRA